jgi:Zn-dependent protease with chaperone function
MQYALNIYAILFILIPSTILLSIVFYIYRCSRKNKSYIPLSTILLSVGISIYLLMIFELLVNFISSLREFRAKGFLIVTYTAF